MSSIKESSLGLNYGWSYGETGWNSGMDKNIVLTGFHANKQIKGILSTPPTTGVSNGDAYIVGSSPTGTWVGNYAKVAIYDRGSWLFATPSTGVSVYNKANGCWYEYNNGWSLKPEAEESPYIKVKDFDFSTGYTITDSRQLLFYPTNQTYYQWNGAVPKVVASGSTPATSGGIGVGAWVDRTDITLLQDYNKMVGDVEHLIGLIPDGVTDNSADILYLFNNYQTLYFPAGTYVISDDRCIDAIRNRLASMDVRFHPDAKFVGHGRLPSSLTNIDHRAQYNYSIKFFGADDYYSTGEGDYSTSMGAQVMAIEAVAKSDFKGNAVGLYTAARGESGSTGTIWALNPLAVAEDGFAGKVRAVEIDLDSKSANTIDSYGLTIWGGGSYDVTNAFRAGRSNSVSLYNTGCEISHAKCGLKITCIGDHPTRSAEHISGINIRNVPKDAIVIRPQSDNALAQVYGTTADGVSVKWRVNNDGSATYQALTTKTSTTDKIITTDHIYSSDPVKIGAYHLWFGASGILRVSTSTPTSGTDGNPFGIKVPVPATATSAGEIGQWAADASYFYVCTATNIWKRVAIASW